MTGIIILNVILCLAVVCAAVGPLARAISVARIDGPQAGRHGARPARGQRSPRRAGMTAVRPSA